VELDKTVGRYQWQVILFCFVLAALTGVLFRFGMIMPLPGELSLQNIRHAHSHLMFFGWAAALPLLIIYGKVKLLLESKNPGLKMMYWSLWAILLFGLLSYPFFLLFGYHPVQVGTTSMPFSVIFSGLVMVGWYLFVAGYLLARKQLTEGDRSTWFEAALVMLVVSSFGAWGVAVAQFMNLANPLVGKALTHFFLACFTEGWVVLSTIAILDELFGFSFDPLPFSAGTLSALILLGAPLTFPYGISETLLTTPMLMTARAGGLITGVSLCLVGYAMLRKDGLPKSLILWPLVLLLLKGVMQVVASVIPSGFWLSDHALRIFYLHVLLLGGFTLAGAAYLHHLKGLGPRSFTGLALSIVIVLFSLLLLTRLWPVAWSGMWIYYVVASAAILPAAGLGAEWWKLSTKSIQK
jgi:hypothetical protein